MGVALRRPISLHPRTYVCVDRDSDRRRTDARGRALRW